MVDKYDAEIADLLALEHKEFLRIVHLRWKAGVGLFRMATANGMLTAADGCGCLTLIRADHDLSAMDMDGNPLHAITAEIRADERIPKSPFKITKESLPAFAEWQRRLDKEIRK